MNEERDDVSLMWMFFIHLTSNPAKLKFPTCKEAFMSSVSSCVCVCVLVCVNIFDANVASRPVLATQSIH